MMQVVSTMGHRNKVRVWRRGRGCFLGAKHGVVTAKGKKESEVAIKSERRRKWIREWEMGKALEDWLSMRIRL